MSISVGHVPNTDPRPFLMNPVQNQMAQMEPKSGPVPDFAQDIVGYTKAFLTSPEYQSLPDEQQRLNARKALYDSKIVPYYKAKGEEAPTAESFGLGYTPAPIKQTLIGIGKGLSDSGTGFSKFVLKAADFALTKGSKAALDLGSDRPVDIQEKMNTVNKYIHEPLQSAIQWFDSLDKGKDAYYRDNYGDPRTLRELLTETGGELAGQAPMFYATGSALKSIPLLGRLAEGEAAMPEAVARYKAIANAWKVFSGTRLGGAVASGVQKSIYMGLEGGATAVGLDQKDKIKDYAIGGAVLGGLPFTGRVILGTAGGAILGGTFSDSDKSILVGGAIGGITALTLPWLGKSFSYIRAGVGDKAAATVLANGVSKGMGEKLAETPIASRTELDKFSDEVANKVRQMSLEKFNKPPEKLSASQKQALAQEAINQIKNASEPSVESVKEIAKAQYDSIGKASPAATALDDEISKLAEAAGAKSPSEHFAQDAAEETVTRETVKKIAGAKAETPAQTVPEQKETLNSQLESVISGNRPAMITTKDNMPTAKIPDELGVLTFRDGTAVVYNKKNLTSDRIKELKLKNRINEILEIPASKPEVAKAVATNGETPVVAVAKDAGTGTEKASAVASNSSLVETVQNLKKHFPDAPVSVLPVTEAGDVVGARLKDKLGDIRHLLNNMSNVEVMGRAAGKDVSSDLVDMMGELARLKKEFIEAGGNLKDYNETFATARNARDKAMASMVQEIKTANENASVTEAVKRGRGRPSGSKNKSTTGLQDLLAQKEALAGKVAESTPAATSSSKPATTSSSLQDLLALAQKVGAKVDEAAPKTQAPTKVKIKGKEVTLPDEVANPQTKYPTIDAAIAAGGGVKVANPFGEGLLITTLRNGEVTVSDKTGTVHGTFSNFNNARTFAEVTGKSIAAANAMTEKASKDLLEAGGAAKSVSAEPIGNYRGYSFQQAGNKVVVSKDGEPFGDFPDQEQAKKAVDYFENSAANVKAEKSASAPEQPEKPSQAAVQQIAAKTKEESKKIKQTIRFELQDTGLDDGSYRNILWKMGMKSSDDVKSVSQADEIRQEILKTHIQKTPFYETDTPGVYSTDGSGDVVKMVTQNPLDLDTKHNPAFMQLVAGEHPDMVEGTDDAQVVYQRLVKKLGEDGTQQLLKDFGYDVLKTGRAGKGEDVVVQPLYPDLAVPKSLADSQGFNKMVETLGVNSPQEQAKIKAALDEHMKFIEQSKKTLDEINKRNKTEADKLAPFFYQARNQLGEKASDAEVEKLAEKLQKQDVGFISAMSNVDISGSFVDDAWTKLSSGKKLVFADKKGTLENKIQTAYDNGKIKTKDDIKEIMSQHYGGK